MPGIIIRRVSWNIFILLLWKRLRHVQPREEKAPERPHFILKNYLYSWSISSFVFDTDNISVNSYSLDKEKQLSKFCSVLGLSFENCEAKMGETMQYWQFWRTILSWPEERKALVMNFFFFLHLKHTFNTGTKFQKHKKYHGEELLGKKKGKL